MTINHMNPLSIIFQSCLKASYFLVAWNKANAFSVHKKGNKKILNNCQTVSLSPICGRLFGKKSFLKKIQFFNT